MLLFCWLLAQASVAQVAPDPVLGLRALRAEALSRAGTPEGTAAAMRWLGELNAAKDEGALAHAVEELSSRDLGGERELEAQLARLKAELDFRRCDVVAREKGKAAAGACYLDWAESHPTARDTADAYYSAFYMLAESDPQRALGAAKALVARFPKSSLAPKALWESSLLLQHLERYAEAAEADERLVRQYPAARETADALYNAAVLRLQAGDCPRARENAKLLEGRAPKGSTEARAAKEVLARCR